MDKAINKDTILITASFLFIPILLFILFFLSNLFLLFKPVFSPMMCPQTIWSAGVFTHYFDVVPAGHLVCRGISVLIITLFYAFTVQQWSALFSPFIIQQKSKLFFLSVQYGSIKQDRRISPVLSYSVSESCIQSSVTHQVFVFTDINFGPALLFIIV